MTDIETVVLSVGEARFDMAGKFLGNSLRETRETIAPGMARRIRAYAVKQLAESGFQVETWPCEISATMEGPSRSDWTYHATFKTGKGGELGVQGIFISARGWPCVDHGFFING